MTNTDLSSDLAFDRSTDFAKELARYQNGEGLDELRGRVIEENGSLDTLLRETINYLHKEWPRLNLEEVVEIREELLKCARLACNIGRKYSYDKEGEIVHFTRTQARLFDDLNSIQAVVESIRDSCSDTEEIQLPKLPTDHEEA